MTISTTDLKLRTPERLTDNADGGGRQTSGTIVDGELNNLFTDISRLDRVTGRVSLRKAFYHVDTANTDMLLGAHVILTDPPDGYHPPSPTSLLASRRFHNRHARRASRLSGLYPPVLYLLSVNGPSAPHSSHSITTELNAQQTVGDTSDDPQNGQDSALTPHLARHRLPNQWPYQIQAPQVLAIFP